MVPLTTISLGSVETREVASAAGIANFGRTLAGAVATALITTLWADLSRSDTAEMSANLNQSEAVLSQLQARGLSLEQARATVAQIVSEQGTALATTHLFGIAAVILFLAAATIWLAPRPPKDLAPVASH